MRYLEGMRYAMPAQERVKSCGQNFRENENEPLLLPRPISAADGRGNPI
jgi:hypothetical protein